MAPILQGSRVIRRSARQVLLSKAFARSAGARSALIMALRARLPVASLSPLSGTWIAMPAPV